jgi:hypothetical protein
LIHQINNEAGSNARLFDLIRWCKSLEREGACVVCQTGSSQQQKGTRSFDRVP